MYGIWHVPPSLPTRPFKLLQGSGRPKMSIKRGKRMFIDAALSAQLSLMAAQFSVRR
jgi:hypothetical protein